MAPALKLRIKNIETLRTDTNFINIFLRSFTSEMSKHLMRYRIYYIMLIHYYLTKHTHTEKSSRKQ